MRWLACLLLLGIATAHPRHASLMDAEHNLKTGMLECVLRVEARDLEAALAPAVLESADKQVQAWLRASFSVTREGTRAPIQWVGHQVSGATAELYFEVAVGSSTTGLTIKNQLFFKDAAQQINQVNVDTGGKVVALVFNPQNPRVTLK